MTPTPAAEPRSNSPLPYLRRETLRGWLARGVLGLGLVACPGAGADSGNGDSGNGDEDADGWLVSAGDCDDTDADVHPGAPEAWGDGLDSDCDGFTMPAASLSEVSLTEWWGDVDGNGNGNGAAFDVSPLGDVDADGRGDLGVSAPCESENETCLAPAAYLLAANVLEGGNLREGADATFSWDRSTVTPWTIENRLQGGGDLNGDTLPDVAMTDLYWPNGETEAAGRVALFNGPFVGEYDIDTADAYVVGADALGHVGINTRVVDADGDGIADLLVSGLGNAGVFLGPLEGVRQFGDADAVVRGTVAFTCLVVVGDTDGDGGPELIVGADTAGQSDPGEAWLVSIPTFGSTDVPAEASRMLGTQTNDFFGQRAAALGDTDGDGTTDFAIGAIGFDQGEAYSAGRASVYLGPRSGNGGTFEADASFTGTAHTAFSWAMATTQSMDGSPEFLVGAPWGPEEPKLPVGKVFDISFAAGLPATDTEANAVLTGSQPGDGAGYAISDGVDLDADGFQDFLVGAPRDDSHGEDAGLVYVVSGQRVARVRDGGS